MFVAVHKNDRSVRKPLPSFVCDSPGKAGFLIMAMSAEEWQFLKSSISRMEQIVCAMKELQSLSLPEDARKIVERNLKTGETLAKELRRKTAN
jgi:hypothetical protein